MGLEIESWDAPVIRVNAVHLSNSNIQEVAKWMGAGFTEALTDVNTLVRTVTFYQAHPDRPKYPGAVITRATLGEYVVRQDAHIDEFGGSVPDRYYRLTCDEIRHFHKSPDKE